MTRRVESIASAAIVGASRSGMLWSVSRRTFASLITVLVAVSGCPRRISPQPASPAPGETEAPAEPEPELPPPASTVPPPDPGPCPGGRLWDGKPQDCSYEHGGCCYESAADACSAAGCAPDRCNVLESYPAQISCRP